MMEKSRRVGPAAAALAAICLAVLMAGGVDPARSAGSGTIDVSEIRPGMKGHGLSVFKGGDPERFEVEVIDVLPNALTRQDLILVRCSGQNLEKSRIVAGMSGSPVYLDNRLAGAIAYGWTFSHDPIAGVTPIKYMINAMNQKIPAPSAAASPPISITDQPEKGAGVPARPFNASDESKPNNTAHAQMTPIATPLLVSGFSPAGLEFIKSELASFNLMPVASGGLSSTRLNSAAAADIGPGHAVGAVMTAGDLSMTAIGTLTHREGDKIAAFGHPFLQGGPLSMPLVSARIHTVISTQLVSFKIGSPEAVVGTLTSDQQAAITGVIGREAPMVPMKINIRRDAAGLKDEYNVDLAKDPTLTPLLIRIGLFEVIRSAAPSLEPTTVRAHSKLKLKKYGEVEYQDLYAVRMGSFSMGLMDPVLFLATNPFEEVEIEELSVDLEITDELKVAVVESVRVDTDEPKPGYDAVVKVALRPYNEPAVEYGFTLQVPDDENMKRLRIIVTGGNHAPPDRAMPQSVKDMIGFMDAVYPSDHLVLAYQVPGQGVDLKGQRLKSLPPSIGSVLQPANTTDTRAAPELVYLTKKTPYVIIGSQRFALELDGNNKKKRR